MVGRRVSMIKKDYGEIGQSLVDGITDTLRTRNAAVLFYISEEKCFQLSGFPETQRRECIEILRQVQSDAFRLSIGEETDQDILFQLIPILNEIDLARTEHELRRNFSKPARGSKSGCHPSTTSETAGRAAITRPLITFVSSFLHQGYLTAM